MIAPGDHPQLLVGPYHGVNVSALFESGRLARTRAFVVWEDTDPPPGVESPDLAFDEDDGAPKALLAKEIEVVMPGE